MDLGPPVAIFTGIPKQKSIRRKATPLSLRDAMMESAWQFVEGMTTVDEFKRRLEFELSGVTETEAKVLASAFIKGFRRGQSGLMWVED